MSTLDLNAPFDDIFYGDQRVDALYVGDEQVYTRASAPITLDTIEADLIAAYSTRSALSTFSGTEVSATSNRVTSWNDQSPNGYDATQATGSNQPYFDAEGVTFDIMPDGSTNGLTRFLSIAAGAQVNRRNLTGYAVIEITELENESRILSFSGDEFALDCTVGGRLRLGHNGSMREFSELPHSGKLVIGFICSPTGVDLYFNGTSAKASFAAYDAGTFGTGRIGNNAAPNTYGQAHEVVLIDDVLSEADLGTLMANAVTAHSVVTSPVKKLVTVGDSKTYARGSELAKPWPLLVQPDADTWVYNYADRGRTASEWAADFTVVAEAIDATTDVVISLGANGLGVQTGAQTFADLEAIVDLAQAAGASQVAVLNLGVSYAASQRDDLNALLAVDPAGGDFLVDVANDAFIGVDVGATVHRDNSYWLPSDDAHENQLGQARIALLVDEALYGGVVPATLLDLAIPASIQQGETVSITNATAGSDIALSAAISGWTVDSAARTITLSETAAPGLVNGVFEETLAGATNTPKTTSFAVTVTALPSGGYTFTNSEAAAYVAEMTVEPDDTRKGHIDTFVGALKTAGVYAKLDGLWLLDAHDEQAARLNLLDPTGTALSGAATFTTDNGFTGNGSNGLDTGFNMSTGTNYVNGDSYFGCWISVGVGDGIPLGSAVQNATAFLNPRNPSGNMAGALGRFIGGAAVADRLGYSSISLFTDDRVMRRNGVDNSTADNSVSNTSAPNDNFLLLGYNAAFTADRMSMACIGANMSTAEDLAIHDAMSAYRTAIGAS